MGDEPQFDKHGQSNECDQDGNGGTWANEVYQIIDDDGYLVKPEPLMGGEVVSKGCFKDAWDRALPYQRDGLGCGQDGLIACENAARKSGLNTFSMQWPDGGC
jgi:hypothetical protein